MLEQEFSDGFDMQSLDHDAFLKLVPIPDQKISKKIKINESKVKRILAITNNKKNIKATKSSQSRKVIRERSRSREKKQIQHPSISHQSKKQFNLIDKQKVIVISDDQQLSQDYIYTKFCERKVEVENLSRNEKRRMERLFERGMKHYVWGKAKDGLSNKIFNTIQEYFR